MTDWTYLPLRAVVNSGTLYLALCACVLLTGCRLILDPDDYAPGTGNEDGDGGPQNGPDSSPNGPPADSSPAIPRADAAMCGVWSTPYFDGLCDIADLSNVPLWHIQPGQYILNTDTETFERQDGVPTNGIEGYTMTYMQHGSASALPALVVIVQQLDIDAGAVIRAIGERPLFFISLSTIKVHGVIDVSSKLNETLMNESLRGAGSGPQSGCKEGNGEGGSGSLKSGGGGGFGAAGGSGGNTSMTGAPDIVGGVGGRPLGLPLAEIRGGCNGGNGGSQQSAYVAFGGRGGGAIMLAAQERIEIGEQGWIDAGGAGGQGGTTTMIDSSTNILEAGAGSGSGGLIVLDAPVIMLGNEISLAANGGGGGGPSSDAVMIGTGGDGQDGYSRSETGKLVTRAAIGGFTPSGFSGGGSGGYNVTPDGAFGVTRVGGGGGGGGGGVGYVLIRATSIITDDNVSTPEFQCFDDERMPTSCIRQ